MIVILGAGISGLSAAYHLKQRSIDSVIYEKNSEWGGLCNNFSISGFRFDSAIHLSFSKSEYVQNLLAKSAEYICHSPLPFNYFSGFWLKHPAQNNIFPLPADQKTKIVTSLIECTNQTVEINNYSDWLKAQYGEYFAENFPRKYTRKYWCCEATDLSVTWVGDRMYKPNLSEVLHGAFSSETPNTYYAKEMRYPKTGGYKSFLKNMVRESDIRLNMQVVKIDTNAKKIYFSDSSSASFTTLISSLPLPVLISVLDEVPADVKEASERLEYTSVALVSVGLSRADIPKHLWFYIYDEEYLPSRCYSPSMKSKDNAPFNKSSLQFEIYFTKQKPLPCHGDELIAHVINGAVKMKMFSVAEVEVTDFRVLPFGNVKFYHGMECDRKLVLEFLNLKQIRTIGRFGHWDYYWSDQSLLSGKEAADSIE